VVEQPDSEPASGKSQKQLSGSKYLQNLSHFMFASLALSDQDTKLLVLKDQRTKRTTGSMVSSLCHLKDPFPEAVAGVGGHGEGDEGNTGVESIEAGGQNMANGEATASNSDSNSNSQAQDAAFFVLPGL
jgi:hypothetical protein